MKKIAFLLFTLTIFSCTSTVVLTPEEIAELEELATKDIEIIFTTTEPNYDEVMVTYYDFSIGDDIAKSYVFKYDVNGNPLPIKIVFDNYKYEYIRGEGFRNNFSEAELKVQVLVDNVLVLEEKSNGTSTHFARVSFNYDIPN